MIETILIILIIACSVLVFNIQSKRETRARREAQKLARLQALKNSGADMNTVKLIGEKAYHEMTDRINTIMERHKMQPCISVRLTCGPEGEGATRQLHKMLPGEEVKLVLCSERGAQYVDVYSQSYRIGRLALLEDMIVRDTMESNHLRGAYVAEQNCYGIKDSQELSIIIFYEPKGEIQCEKTLKLHKKDFRDRLAPGICEN